MNWNVDKAAAILEAWQRRYSEVGGAGPYHGLHVFVAVDVNSGHRSVLVARLLHFASTRAKKPGIRLLPGGLAFCLNS